MRSPVKWFAKHFAGKDTTPSPSLRDTSPKSLGIPYGVLRDRGGASAARAAETAEGGSSFDASWRRSG